MRMAARSNPRRSPARGSTEPHKRIKKCISSLAGFVGALGWCLGVSWEASPLYTAARALYRRHTALILDEPSSNLDPRAEHKVFDALRKLTDGKMAIFTSHRLSNVFLADRIVVFEEGRVIEDGTQGRLLRDKHRFAELYKYQSDKFKHETDMR